MTVSEIVAEDRAREKSAPLSSARVVRANGASAVA